MGNTFNSLIIFCGNEFNFITFSVANDDNLTLTLDLLLCFDGCLYCIQILLGIMHTVTQICFMMVYSHSLQLTHNQLEWYFPRMRQQAFLYCLLWSFFFFFGIVPRSLNFISNLRSEIIASHGSIACFEIMTADIV